jgi:hypothetical protein
MKRQEQVSERTTVTTMEGILALLIMPVALLAAMGVAALTWGVDSRDPMTDDHLR